MTIDVASRCRLRRSFSELQRTARARQRAAIGRGGGRSQRRSGARARQTIFNFSRISDARKIGRKTAPCACTMRGRGQRRRAGSRLGVAEAFFPDRGPSREKAAATPRPGKSDGAGRREARRRGRPVAAPRGFFPDPRARFYSAHGKQFCPIINRAIVGGWLYARGAFHTSECNGNQIERRRARGLSAGVKTR